MVLQSPLEQFSWNALISNFVSKHDSSEASKSSEAEEPKLELEPEQRQSKGNRGASSSEARDDVGCSSDPETCTPFDEPQTCTPFDETSCVQFDDSSCTPRTSAEMKMDLNNIRNDIAEIVKEHQRLTEKAEGKSPGQETCVHFSLDCNPEAVASKEERKKPVIDRKDDTLDYIFNLVEIAICGDKKSDIDNFVTKQPTKQEQMPDPVQLLRAKSIFQTLNPGKSNNSKKRSSRSQTSAENGDKSATSKTASFDKLSKKQENVKASTSEASKTEISKHEDPTADTSTMLDSKPQASTTEARELRALRLKAASTISMPEVIMSFPDTAISNVSAPAVSMTQPSKVKKTEEAVSASKSVSDTFCIAVPPTIPEEPSNSQESASSQETEERKKQTFVEELAMAVLAEAEAVAAETDAVAAETDESVSHAPQSSVHVDGSHDSVSLITDFGEYYHSPPRVIHLSDSEAKQTKPAQPLNIYSPSIRKLQEKKRVSTVSSALAAYNKKVRRGVNFGCSTSVLGKQGYAPTTTLATRNTAGNEQIIQLLAGLLSMGQSNNINAPATPRGVIFLASVVSFLFWPEDFPKDQMMQKLAKQAPVEEPEEDKDAPSLLSLVGDKKSKSTSSLMKRNRPRRPQISSRRMNALQKKSFDV